MSTEFPIEYTMKRIHFKARQLLGKRGFTEDDFGDLRQELMLDVLERLLKFKGAPVRIKPFICRLIDHRIASLIKHREAACRDYRRVQCSFDDFGHDRDGNWTTLNKTLIEGDATAYIGRGWRSRQEQLELALDTETVLGQLGDGDRKLCLDLQAKTPMEISKESGGRRAGIYDRRRRIRKNLLRSEMQHYL
jgi:RNA polymerase sigma-70 factor (ECF subfamily)